MERVGWKAAWSVWQEPVGMVPDFPSQVWTQLPEVTKPVRPLAGSSSASLGGFQMWAGPVAALRPGSVVPQASGTSGFWAGGTRTSVRQDCAWGVYWSWAHGTGWGLQVAVLKQRLLSNTESRCRQAGVCCPCCPSTSWVNATSLAPDLLSWSHSVVWSSWS